MQWLQLSKLYIYAENTFLNNDEVILSTLLNHKHSMSTVYHIKSMNKPDSWLYNASASYGFVSGVAR